MFKRNVRAFDDKRFKFLQVFVRSADCLDEFVISGLVNIEAAFVQMVYRCLDARQRSDEAAVVQNQLTWRANDVTAPFSATFLLYSVA